MGPPGSARLLAVWVALPALAGCVADDGDSARDPAESGSGLPPEVAYRVDASPVEADEFRDRFPEAPVGTARYLGAGAFEPTLGADASGALFYSAYNYANGEDGDVFRSFDQGRTWEEVSPAVAGEQFPPFSNDNYVHVDVDTGRVYTVDLQALACSTLSYSDTQGSSWITNPIGCGHPVGVHDHQTVWTAKPRQVATAGYPNLVYYCVNRLVDSACATSLNGGLTFGPLRPLIFHDLGEGDEELPCGGLHAHGAAAPDGTAYLPKGNCAVPQVAITKDDGLTWTVAVIAGDVEVYGHEVAFAVDDAGHAYAFWIGTDLKPWFAASPDGGTAWNAALMVAPPGIATTDFPTIAAGSDGRVVVAYYGSSGDQGYNSMGSNDTWHGFLTMTTNALDAQPVFVTVTANPPSDPLARGVCGGGRCDGVGDFIDVIIDSQGRPWAAFVDVCNRHCVDGSREENVDVEGLVGTLLTGTRLRGDLEALPRLDGAQTSGP